MIWLCAYLYVAGVVMTRAFIEAKKTYTLDQSGKVAAWIFSIAFPLCPWLILFASARKALRLVNAEKR